MSQTELEAIAEVAKELDLLVISDEVYEHYVTGENPHTPIATLPGMWERTITVNSFSKSWNISGLAARLCLRQGRADRPDQQRGECHLRLPGDAAAGRAVEGADGGRRLLHEAPRQVRRETRSRFARALRDLGFDIYDSGSAFYLWARIPEEFTDAITFNEMLMEKAGVGMTPGAAFADSDMWDAYVRICIAREDHVLEGAMEKLREASWLDQ